MNFKRKEGFRYVFNEPLSGKFTLITNGRTLGHEYYPCKILDISPRGMKLFSEAEINEYMVSTLKFEIHFILDVTNIRAVGDIVWSKPYGAGKQYGILLQDQADIDELIIEEMKRRRKKEVFQAKLNKF